MFEFLNRSIFFEHHGYKLVFGSPEHHLTVDYTKSALTILGILVVSRIVKFVGKLRRVDNLPGQRPPFMPLGLPGALFPTSWWNAGADMHWIRRGMLYKESETISIVPWIVGPPLIYSSNLDVLRQISSGQKSCFIKPETASRSLLLFGINLAAADGDVWRRHRRIMGPAFNSRLYQLVWEETIKTYRDMVVAEGWSENDTVEIPAIQTLTFKFALLVLGTCGFGFDFNWSAPPETSEGEMTVQEAIRTVLDANMMLSFAPEWMKRLPFSRFKRPRDAYNQLTRFMHHQVHLRKAEVRGQTPEEYKRDAFSMLVQANEDAEGKYRLNDVELIGNVFVMLFAGHETSAHTLAATLGFLAVNEDAQDAILQEIINVVGYDRDPVFDDYNNLNKVLSAFYEALRLFPSGHVLIREPTEDTTIEIPSPRGQEGTEILPVQKGSWVILDMIGLQRNPRYFEDPMEYKPSRWHGIKNDSDQFSAFSLGPRGCIGRKFATTEAVCFLAMLLRDFKVEPLLQAGETKDQWKERILDGKIILTLGVLDVPVTFKRRARKH
ncbi:cytochrome P450 [Marasmius fiardii PR-910]|nr:cytochrome P450 [Marasmius fiardii PR-910]